ncbi:hypothetical protein CHC121_15000 [Helicobacter pylori]
MHKHTIYLRGNALYLNYTKNSKRHRVSLSRLTKSLNLENDKALEYLEGLSLEKILKMLKGALKPNEEPKQGSQRTAKKTKNITIAQAKESFFNQKIGLKEESLPKTNALKPLAFSYGDTRRNAFRRANME